MTEVDYTAPVAGVKRNGARAVCVCKKCNKEFRPKRCDTVSYCSRECSFADIKAWYGKPKRKIIGSKKPHFCNVFFKACSVCSKSFVTRFSKKLTCSDECANQRQLMRKRDAYEPAVLSTHSCVTCGGAYSTNNPTHLYCSKKCVPKRNNHRSRARHAGVFYEPVNAVRVLDRDGWKCQVCGVSTPRSRRGTVHKNAPELDHRVPMAMGGPHTYDNTQCACRSCNLKKGGSLSVGQTPLFMSLPSVRAAGGVKSLIAKTI